MAPCVMYMPSRGTKPRYNPQTCSSRTILPNIAATPSVAPEEENKMICKSLPPHELTSYNIGISTSSLLIANVSGCLEENI
eukprot:scaffold411607_cov50-Prasinocladus_malaysianus.AAC.1